MNPDGTAAVGQTCLYHAPWLGRPTRVTVLSGPHFYPSGWWCYVRKETGGRRFHTMSGRLEVLR